MKLSFIYPTKKNYLIFLLLYQLVPFLFYIFGKSNLWQVLRLEAVGIALLSLWPAKPKLQMDERELHIELKWKNIMLEFTFASVLLPLFYLMSFPEASGWNVFRIYTIPVFSILVITSILYKKEIGTI